MNREAFEKAVAELSPLSVAQVEQMFGEVNESNKAAVWRTLNMPHHQQLSIWQCFLHLRKTCPDMKVEAVR